MSKDKNKNDNDLLFMKSIRKGLSSIISSSLKFILSLPKIVETNDRDTGVCSIDWRDSDLKEIEMLFLSCKMKDPNHISKIFICNTSPSPSNTVYGTGVFSNQYTEEGFFLR